MVCLWNDLKLSSVLLCDCGFVVYAQAMCLAVMMRLLALGL